MQERTRSQMLEDIVANLANHAETGQIPKPYRRGSWRPIGEELCKVTCCVQFNVHHSMYCIFNYSLCFPPSLSFSSHFYSHSLHPWVILIEHFLLFYANSSQIFSNHLFSNWMPFCAYHYKNLYRILALLIKHNHFLYHQQKLQLLKKHLTFWWDKVDKKIYKNCLSKSTCVIIN